MRYILSFLFYLAFMATARGQSNYAEAIRQGDSAFNKQQYKTAINKYFAAEAFDPAKKDSVKAKVNRTFDRIETLRLEAIQAKLQAVLAKMDAKPEVPLFEPASKKLFMSSQTRPVFVS